MYDKVVFRRYADAFSHLHVKVTFGQRAPHKAIMLISVIDLIETGVIDFPVIHYTQQLESQFRHNWQRYIAYLDGFNCSPSLPFWHLEHEGFWKLVLKEDCSKTKKELNDARIYNSPKRMMSVVNYATIDLDLFNILQDSCARAKLRVLLISMYCNY